MRLHIFIELRQNDILTEWDAFATSLHSTSLRMTRDAIRDHAREILLAVAADLAQEQTVDEQFQKSVGNASVVLGASHTAAQTHALLRQKSGFDINELIAEYRAFRASVLRLWAAEVAPAAVDLQDTIRFNEAIDQALTESVTQFTSELERSRNLLMGMLGHDMRNPLAVIVTTAVHLKMLDIGEVVSRAAGRLISSGARLRSLLDDLVDFLLRAAYLTNQLDFEQSGNLCGNWDAERLHQLLGNLVSNALKYGDKASPVTVRVDGLDDHISIEVSNGGEPIAPDFLAEIFKPLKRGQARDADGDVGEGLGLGLYIVSEVARAHGGEVSVTSDESLTRFKVVLPRTTG